jgi:hypothetical protein
MMPERELVATGMKPGADQHTRTKQEQEMQILTSSANEISSGPKIRSGKLGLALRSGTGKNAGEPRPDACTDHRESNRETKLGGREIRSARGNEERQKRTLLRGPKNLRLETKTGAQTKQRTKIRSSQLSPVSALGLTEGKILHRFDRMQLKNKIRQEQKG